MNEIKSVNYSGPFGDEQVTCAMLTIDNVYSPFVLHNISEVNKEYTFSLYIRSDTEGSITVGGETIKTTAEWTNHAVTFIADSIDVSIFFNVIGTYYLYNTQLEIGNRNTDWRPAVEDVEQSISDTRTYFDITSESIRGEVVATEGRMSSLIEQTASSITARLNGVESTANNAVKTTNYLNFSQNGLVIGDHTTGTLGRNVLINSDSVDIRNGDTVLARYGDDEIHLGMDNPNSAIYLCNDVGVITAEIDDASGIYENLKIDSPNGYVNVHSSKSIRLDSEYNGTNNTYYSSSVYVEAYNSLNGTDNCVSLTASKLNTSSFAIDTSSINILADSIYLLSSSGGSGKLVSINMDGYNGYIQASSEIISTNPNGFRIAYGNYGSFIRNDGNSTYFLLTNSGDIYGKWNSLRPLIINNSTGNVTINDTALETNGNVTPNNHLVLKNTKGVHIKNASGTNIEMLSVTNSNVGVIGYGPYANNYPLQIHGGTIRFYTKTPNVNWKPYFSPGDSITVRWRGAGFVTGSGTDIAYAVPLAKPAVGCSGVTVTTADGFIIRQNDKYCYGSTSSTQVKNITSHNAGLAGDSHVRIITGFTNNTNVTNNSAIGIDASVTITFV